MWKGEVTFAIIRSAKALHLTLLVAHNQIPEISLHAKLNFDLTTWVARGETDHSVVREGQYGTTDYSHVQPVYTGLTVHP